jgi:hypothetical protein
MPNEPLADPRLDAAAQIRKSVLGGNLVADGAIQDARRAISQQPNRASTILSAAIRETKAAELAEALEWLIEACKYVTFDNGVTHQGLSEADWFSSGIIDKANATLASFKELTNDRS